MKITQITYGKTINIGNYQSIRVDFTADVDPPTINKSTGASQPGDDADGVLELLKQIVKASEEKILRENNVKQK